MSIFTVTDYDKKVYNEQIKDYLPNKIIDIHTHIWKGAPQKNTGLPKRTVSWTTLVAKENTIEDIQEAYKLFFPDKQVTPLLFASKVVDLATCKERNDYVAEAMKVSGFPALYYSHPLQNADDVEREIFKHGYLGLKSYLNLSPNYIPGNEIRILDFFTPELLKMLNKNGLMAMVHIPRNERFKDPVNIAQIKHIAEKYPNVKLVIAHVGRAYCKVDVGDAFEQLKDYKDIYYDFTANTSSYVFEQLLKNVSPDKIMFGSDEPIIRMRMRRIEENNTYINLVPPGLYGDTSIDPHLREVSKEEAKTITFFMYEEILAMKEATAKLGMGRDVVDKLFYGTADKLIKELEAKVR